MFHDPKNDNKRHERINKKLKAVLSEIAEDLMEPDELEAIKDFVHKQIRRENHPVNLATLTAFALGFEFGSSTHNEYGNGPEFPSIMAGVRWVVKQQKIDVDISKVTTQVHAEQPRPLE